MNAIKLTTKNQTHITFKPLINDSKELKNITIKNLT